MCFSKGVKTENCSNGGLDLANIENGDYVKVSGVDFGSGAEKFTANIASATDGGDIEIYLDSLSGKKIGTCQVPSTGGWQDWKKDEIHSFTFTISKDQVKKMRDTAIETGYEGLHLQSAGDAIVTKVTFNAGNILTDKQYAEWQESAGEGAVWGA